MQFLSDEWLAAVRADVPGAPAGGIEVTALGAPGGDVTWHLRVADGQVHAASGPLAGADVVLTIPYDDLVAIARGELEPSVAFMRGRMKTAGDPGMLLDVVGATARPGFRAARDELASATDF